jgi:hypothetical protein
MLHICNEGSLSGLENVASGGVEGPNREFICHEANQQSRSFQIKSTAPNAIRIRLYHIQSIEIERRVLC